MKSFFEDSPELVGVLCTLCIIAAVIGVHFSLARRNATEITHRDAPSPAPGEVIFTERAVKRYACGVFARLNAGVMDGREKGVNPELYKKLAGLAKTCSPEHTLQALVLLGASDALLLEVEDWNKDSRIPMEYRIVFVAVDSSGSLGFRTTQEAARLIQQTKAATSLRSRLSGAGGLKMEE